MLTNFWKMHGAGNDFIIVDDQKNKFPAKNTNLISYICQRHTGIGSDGLILIQLSDIAEFKMVFFNPNGMEAEMCGNGARCIARFAYDQNIANSSMKFETRAGIISAEIIDQKVKLNLPPATNYKRGSLLEFDNAEDIEYDFINTGVPHAVVRTANLNSYPVTINGHAVIKHQAFAPEETNVNFAEICENQQVNIRTYERGVEDETLACGTGITATAITLALRGLVSPPVSVKTVKGDILIVDFVLKNNKASDISLTGPAAYVFEGNIDL